MSFVKNRLSSSGAISLALSFKVMLWFDVKARTIEIIVR